MSRLVQGQGFGTPSKEDGFAKIFAASLAISKAKPCLLNYPYWHIDLNSGCGYNDKVACDGSPVVFLDEAIKADRRFVAFFCDNKRDHVLKLHQAIVNTPIPKGSTARAFCSDNAHFLAIVGDFIAGQERPQYAVGSLLCDPNGPSVGFPYEALQVFARKFPRIDLIVNLPLRYFTLQESHRRNGHPTFSTKPTLIQLVLGLDRPEWSVRQPQRGTQRFITFLGRSCNIAARRFHDFYPLSSEAGRHIVTQMRRWDPPAEPPDLDPQSLLSFMLEKNP